MSLLALEVAAVGAFRSLAIEKGATLESTPVGGVHFLTSGVHRATWFEGEAVVVFNTHLAEMMGRVVDTQVVIVGSVPTALMAGVIARFSPPEGRGPLDAEAEAIAKAIDWVSVTQSGGSRLWQPSEEEYDGDDLSLWVHEGSVRLETPFTNGFSETVCDPEAVAAIRATVEGTS